MNSPFNIFMRLFNRPSSATPPSQKDDNLLSDCTAPVSEPHTGGTPNIGGVPAGAAWVDFKHTAIYASISNAIEAKSKQVQNLLLTCKKENLETLQAYHAGLCYIIGYINAKAKRPTQPTQTKKGDGILPPNPYMR